MKTFLIGILVSIQFIKDVQSFFNFPAAKWPIHLRTTRSQTLLPLQLSESEPDSSTEPLPTDIEPSGINKKSEFKEALMGMLDKSALTKESIAVNELICKLEPLNPTPCPAKSQELNGVWEFLYRGGKSPSVLALQLLTKLSTNFSSIIAFKEVNITISRDQPRVEASLDLSVAGRPATIKVKTSLNADSDIRLLEKYEEAEIEGNSIPLPPQFQLKRTIFITYLDDDILISRDENGSPDILFRKEKQFLTNDGIPSYTDSDLSPGSG